MTTQRWSRTPHGSAEDDKITGHRWLMERMLEMGSEGVFAKSISTTGKIAGIVCRTRSCRESVGMEGCAVNRISGVVCAANAIGLSGQQSVSIAHGSRLRDENQ